MSLRAVVLGYHDVGCVGLETLLNSGDDVVALFSHRNDPRENIWFGSVAELAAARGIPVHFPDDINEPRWVDAIREYAPDIIFSFYFRQLVSDRILTIPSLGGLNLHPSLLPRYRGRSPVNWVLVNGETETGVTLHYMVRRADAGDIVAQRSVSISSTDTALTLHRKIVREAGLLLLDALPGIRAGTNPRQPQDLSRGSYVGRRRPEDGRIDWNRPATRIHDLVRAVTHPFPGAFTFLGDRKLYVWDARPDPRTSTAPAAAGHLHPGPELRVATGDGDLVLLRLQFDGEPELDASELASRHSLPAGTIFG